MRQLGVVITGGSTGLGFELAAGFLEAGDQVVICGRNAARIERALEALAIRVPSGVVHGMVCDVSHPPDLTRFLSFVRQRLGRVNRWINNAGSAGSLQQSLWELRSEEMLELCSTNLAGSMMACAGALRLMLEQPPSQNPVYHVFNMGFSSAGARFSRSSIPHRVSKTAVASLTAFLSEELLRNAITSVGVHELSPGMVKTGLLFRGVSPETGRFLEAVAEDPEKVAKTLVPKIRHVATRSRPLRYASFAETFVRSIKAILVSRKAFSAP
ncbi:MAG: SDR family oxidoreductase [Chlorobium limicola]|uniref:SDR family oxidoreductase n=1 Tax=Chlorobium limicola TaxID=1092 RepID=UPI0023F26C95|nr:SDR family oxidoreductase [Chlorobium limicola]NTV21493.1 SDR family oxidoreductase [Chlorobium limicola]